jgi:hypothetical protein
MRDFVERWWCGREPVLGLDIRDTGMVVADVNLRGKNRWRTVDASSLHGGVGGVLKDTRALSSLLREFVSSSPTRVYRCAVAFPESLTSISWLTLSADIVDKPERVRFEAALERLYLRPQDVKGRVYLIKRSAAESPNALLVAAKAADVALLEDSVGLAGLELACLTPRVFALHHLVSLSGLLSTEALVAYSDPSPKSPLFHLFNRSHYHSTVRELGEFLRGVERYMEASSRSNGSGRITLLSNGDDRTAALLQDRYTSARVIPMREFVLGGTLTLDPEQVVASALSLFEARPG